MFYGTLPFLPGYVAAGPLLQFVAYGAGVNGLANIGPGV
jgi:hypothetical protein